MPTASDRHAARLAFQRMRVLIADSARHATVQVAGARRAQINQLGAATIVGLL